MSETVTVIVNVGDSGLAPRILRVLMAQLEARAGISAESATSAARAAGPVILVNEAADFAGSERYRIRTSQGPGGPQITITGHGLGLLYGVGRLLREIKRVDGHVTWPRLNDDQTPASAVRGVYFPTQTHPSPLAAPFNAYTVWLIKENRFAEFEQVLVELMLWGLNTIGLWYAEWMDAPWDDTPQGRKAGAAYRRVIAIARSWQLKFCLLMTPNLVPTHVHQRYPRYNCEKLPRGLWAQFPVPNMLCPSVPAVRNYLLDYNHRLIKEFQPDWIEIFPTDPGGCDCPKCLPWWKNYWQYAMELLGPWKDTVPMRSINFWYFWNRDARKLAALVKNSDVVNTVSTQVAWQEDSAARLRISDGLAKQGKKIIFWPDITMVGGWGTYGTYPYLKGLLKLFDLASIPYGVLPYTEGRYDDINKFAMLSLAWQPRQDLRSLARTVLEGAFNQAMPRHAVDAVLAIEDRRFAQARRNLAAARRQLDAQTVTNWRWYSLDFYARHAELGDLGSALLADLKQARERLPAGHKATAAACAAWARRLTHLRRKATAAAAEMPKLHKLVNDFRRPSYPMCCGTRARSREELLGLTGLAESAKLLAEIRGRAVAAADPRAGDAVRAMNLHEAGKRRKAARRG